MANKMTQEEIGSYRTGTLDGNRSSTYTETTPDDCTTKDVTNIGLHPTQDISSKTTLHASSCTTRIKKPDKIQLFSSLLQIHIMFCAPLHFTNYKNHALLDTGAVQIAMSENELKKIQTVNSQVLLKEITAPEFKIQSANRT